MITRTPPQIVGVNAEALATVFRRVLAEKRLTQPEELTARRSSPSRRRSPKLKRYCGTEGHTILEALLQRAGSRFEVVVMFLAVLELWHQARLKVTQQDLFGSIEIQPGRNFTKVTSEAILRCIDPLEASAFDPSRRSGRHACCCCRLWRWLAESGRMRLSLWWRGKT